MIGHDRLPSFEDRPNLPYLNAIVNEVRSPSYRSPAYHAHPVDSSLEPRRAPGTPAPLHARGRLQRIPHSPRLNRICQHLVRHTYHDHETLQLISHTRGILHNETMYPSPMEFMPERYLDTPAQADPKRFAFGYGRRGCPAKDLADDSIFITAAMTLAAFNLARPPASTAQPQYTSGLIWYASELPVHSTMLNAVQPSASVRVPHQTAVARRGEFGCACGEPRVTLDGQPQVSTHRILCCVTLTVFEWRNCSS